MVVRSTVNGHVYLGDKVYVGECLEIAVVTQGKTIEEAVGNLREAVAMYFDGEDMAALGFVTNPTLRIAVETSALPHAG